MYLHSWDITRVVCGLKIRLAIIMGWDEGLKFPKRPTVTVFHNVYTLTKAVTNGGSIKDYFSY